MVLLGLIKCALEKVSEVLANLCSVYVTWKLTRSFQIHSLLFYERGESEWVNVSKTTEDYVDIQYDFIGTNKNYGWYYAMNSYDEALNKVTQLSMESKEKFLICKALRWVQWH